MPCENCIGLGLISTGAVAYDLSVGNKVTCPVCHGTGKQLEPEVIEEAPKAPEPMEAATGEVSGTPSEIEVTVEPQVGDPCLTDNDEAGHLERDENGAWVCVL